MCSFILSVAVAVLSLIAAPKSIEAALVKRAGQFHPSCSNVKLVDWTLEASCKQSNGGVKSSTLDLNKCFTNAAGGYLRCQPQE